MYFPTFNSAKSKEKGDENKVEDRELLLQKLQYYKGKGLIDICDRNEKNVSEVL